MQDERNVGSGAESGIWNLEWIWNLESHVILPPWCHAQATCIVRGYCIEYRVRNAISRKAEHRFRSSAAWDLETYCIIHRWRLSTDGHLRRPVPRVMPINSRRCHPVNICHPHPHPVILSSPTSNRMDLPVWYMSPFRVHVDLKIVICEG